MIRELTSSDDPQVPGVLDLAHRLFPSDTLEPDERLLDDIDGVRPGDVRFFVWDENDPRGFCRAAWISAGVLIVHLGVEPEGQGRGIGSRLLEALRNVSGDATIFAEVETGAPMTWWRSKGARVIEPRYLQPPLRPGAGAVPLALMAIGPVESVPEAVASIYGEFYRRGEGDPLLTRILEGAAS